MDHHFQAYTDANTMACLHLCSVYYVLYSLFLMFYYVVLHEDGGLLANLHPHEEPLNIIKISKLLSIWPTFLFAS